MERLSALRRYRYSDPPHRQLQPGGRSRAGLPLLAACAPISKDRWRKKRFGCNIKRLVTEERRTGPEVGRSCNCRVLIAGEKKATEWDCLKVMAAAELSLTRCSVWEGGWSVRQRRKGVKSAFLEQGAREEGVLTTTSGLHRSALGQTRSPRWSEITSKPWDRVACEWVAVAAVSTGVTEGSGSRFQRLRKCSTNWEKEAPVVVIWLPAIQTR